MIEVLRITLLVIGAIPLIIYPFIAIASIMGIASTSSLKVPLYYRVMGKFFLWGTLIYPLIYGVFLYCSNLFKQTTGLIYALASLVFLLMLWISSRFMDAPPRSSPAE